MKAKTLRENIQKRTLSAKNKKSFKPKQKFSLAKPVKKFRCDLTEDDETKLTKLLEEKLHVLKTDRIRVPYSQIKSLTRNERKELRKQNRDNAQVEPKYAELRRSIICGVNQVSRMLQKDALAAVIIDKSALPIMISHVLEMCNEKHVPSVFSQDLKNVVKKHLDVKTLTVGFEKKKECVEYFHGVIDLLRQVSQNDKVEEKSKIPESMVMEIDNGGKNETNGQNKSSEVYSTGYSRFHILRGSVEEAAINEKLANKDTTKNSTRSTFQRYFIDEEQTTVGFMPMVVNKTTGNPKRKKR